MAIPKENRGRQTELLGGFSPLSDLAQAASIKREHYKRTS